MRSKCHHNADLDGDSNWGHLNVHISELQGETDPADGTERQTPDPTVRIEIDNHADNTQVLRSGS